MLRTYRKDNGDLNIDIESVLEIYPEIVGSKCDDAEQKAISVALIPYLIEEMQKDIKVERINQENIRDYKKTEDMVNCFKQDVNRQIKNMNYVLTAFSVILILLAVLIKITG